MENVHMYEKEVFNKKNDIAELQKMISDAHLAIYDERSQFMKLKKDYDFLQCMLTIYKYYKFE